MRRQIWESLTDAEIIGVMENATNTQFNNLSPADRDLMRSVVLKTQLALYRKNTSPYAVDGLHTDGTMQGDGESPPFQIFDIHKQAYVPGQYKTREDAETVMRMLKT